MCGFIGVIRRHGADSPVSSESLERGLEYVRRRGPDSQRCWHGAEGRVSLAFARLAIVDQDSSAHQPLTSSIAPLTAVLNGEIYNYEELRRELRHYPFRTKSDTEVLLAAFAAWGVKGFSRLRGMFAGAIVDQRLKSIFLFRDPIGKKPLFVSDTPDGVVFGSSILAIAAVRGAEVRLNDGAISAFWRHEYVLPDTSILESCRPVMPGEVWEYDFNGEFVQLHSCRPQAAVVVPRRLEEAHAECSRLLQESVALRVHNNPKPVSLLSGGIDSTVVTQTMSKLVHGDSITLASRLPLTPDERYARYAGRRLGVSVQPVRISTRSMADDVQWALSLQDEPLGMMSFFMLAHLVRCAKDYGRILLTGDGGDEVFLGYGRSADWTSHADVNEAGGENDWMVGPPAPNWMSPWGRFAVRQQLLGHMFTKVDRASAEQGVEIRSPLLDWDLMAFARMLPPSVLLRNDRMKALLKAQLHDWPEWFIERPKVGFTFRLRWLWLTGGFSGLRELVSDEAVQRFSHSLPPPLQSRPRTWTTVAIFRHFKAVWKLLTWTAFERRLAAAQLSR